MRDCGSGPKAPPRLFARGGTGAVRRARGSRSRTPRSDILTTTYRRYPDTRGAARTEMLGQACSLLDDPLSVPVVYRGRGRSGGRAVSGRGRIRNRGPSGGGTLRSELPQQGQRPSSLKARVASARSQWPRASHCGLMHCTVKPGRNCMSFPSAAGALSRRRPGGADPIPLATDGFANRRPTNGRLYWRGFWRTARPLSRPNTTIYCGHVAPGRWHIRCRPGP